MLYNRKFEITVQVDNILKTYSGGNISLNVDFNITKTMGGVGEKADITLYGIPLEDIQSLATVMMNRGSQVPPRNYVRFSAGYEDDYGQVFEGGIFEATPNVDSADMSIKLSCISGYAQDRSVEVDKSYKETTLKAIAQDIADILVMPLVFNAADKPVKSYSFKGRVFQQMEEFRRMSTANIKIFISGNTLYVDDILTAGNKVVRISEESGMVGSPQPTLQGVIVKTLLRSSLEAGGSISLKSVKLPATDGIYRILSLKHIGSTRGDQFYSEIFGQRLR